MFDFPQKKSKTVFNYGLIIGSYGDKIENMISQDFVFFYNFSTGPVVCALFAWFARFM